ncbi:MAG: leucine-rich repeat domain-containing protein [Clostridia bacterium]|nr:leucine-rich repeat domain-containing protein [Clostridia bacterium]
MKKKSVFIIVAVIALIVALCGVFSQITGTCGEDLRWSYNPFSKTLYVSGNGDMFDYSSTTASPWREKSFCNDITSLKISEGVTSIGDYAFERVWLDGTICFPESMKEIGENAFCSNSIEKAVFPNGLVEIGKRAFANCNISELSLPDSLERMGAYAFSDNDIKSVAIPGKITVLEESLFSGCTGLESIYIPVSVKKIENSVFYNTNASFKDVYYGGTKKQWKMIDIYSDDNFYPLYSAEIHYESY